MHQARTSLQLHKVLIFHGVSLSVSSLVLAELKGRGCKKRGLGNRITKAGEEPETSHPWQSYWECRGVIGWGKPGAESPFPHSPFCKWLCGWSPASGELKPAIEELFDLRQRAVLDFLLRKEYKWLRSERWPGNSPFMKGLVCF